MAKDFDDEDDQEEEEALDREEQETDEPAREEPEQPEEPELSNIQLSSGDEAPAPPEEPAPDWNTLSPQGAAPDWDSLAKEPPVDWDKLSPTKPDNSTVGAVERGAARSTPGGIGTLGGAYLGATLMPIQHPVAKLAGAAGGAILGGLGADVAWRAARAKFGYSEDPAQLEADEREHPWAKAVGETIPYAASMAYGKVDPIIRLVGAGIMGTIDLAQQLFHTGTVDPVELGIRSLPGAMGGFNRPAAALGESVAQAAGRAVGIDAATVSQRVGMLAARPSAAAEAPAAEPAAAEAPAAEAATEPPEQPFEPGRPDQSAGETAQENQVKADAEVPNTAPKAPGAAVAEPAPSKEELPAATLETERSERRYPKDEPAGEDAESGVNEIEHADPAVEEALSQALGKKEPAAEPPAAAGELPPGEQETGIPDFLRRPKPGQRPPTEQTIQPETAAAPEPAQPAQGMTTKMKRDLADRGVSAEEAATLTPEEVQQRLAQPAAEPQLPKDVRNQLYKAGVPRDRVRTMAPEEAQRILSGEQTVEPAPATPKQQANALYQQAVEHVRNGGEATPEALQRELGVTPEQANKLAGRLEKAGLSAPPVRQGEESGGLSPSRNTEPEAQAQAKTPPAGEATPAANLSPEAALARKGSGEQPSFMSGVGMNKRPPEELAEPYTLPDKMLDGKKKQQAFETASTDAGPVGDVLRRATAAFDDAVKQLKDAGYNPGDMGVRNSAELRAPQKRISEIGGMVDRLITGITRKQKEGSTRVDDDIAAIKKYLDDMENPSAAKAKPQPQSVGAAAAGARTFTPGQVAIAKSKLGEALNEFGPVRAFRTAFTPEHLTQDTATFENIVREGQSTTNRARLQYDRSMDNLEKTINDHSSADHRNEFAATFQTGVPRSNPLSRFANDALDVERGYQARLNKVDPDGNFQNNFLPKLFADADAAKNQVIDWKDQGRKGPFTIGDFLAEGHQLRPDVLRADGSIDPIRLQQRLNTGRDMFLESKSIVNKALDEGILSHQQGPGMERVEELSRGGQPIYAPPEVATMANRYFEQALKDPTDKSFWDTAQRVKNFGTMWQLMGGTYHMVAETTEAIIGDVQRAIQHAAAGDFGKAGKLLGQAAGAPIRQATSSARKALEAYYDPAKAAPEVRAAVDHLVSGGLTAERVARYTPDINSAGRNFWEAWKKGALEMEFREKGARIGAAYERGLPAAAKQTSVEAFKFLGEAMQTVTHPMFNVYIPRLKIGAALEQMTDFMAANPNATAREHQDAAKRILKSIDDRLGELNQSTLFWNNTLKRGANLAMISPGWETGTLRAFLGGTKDLIANPRSISVASGADFRPNAAYPLAFAITTAAVGSMYQFLKTGQVPETPHDAFFPKTGGTVKGQPEHAILPGYLKDVYSWWSALAGEKGMMKSASTMAYNKLALVPHAVWDTMANQDWAGKQIYNPSDPLQKKLGEYLGYVQRNMMPIAVQQLTRDQPKGSGISKAEAVVGLKKAPSEWKGQTAANNKAQKEADRFHRKLGY